MPIPSLAPKPARLRRYGLLLLVGSLATILGVSCGRRNDSDRATNVSENLVSPNNAITQAADELRDGWFPDQPALDPATVGGPNFNQLFKTALPLTPGEQVLAQPLVYNGKVLVVSEANNLYLIDANTGAITNQRALGAAFNVQNGVVGCSDLLPTVGITGTPVIDNATGTAYLLSKSDAPAWTLHAISMADLSERPGPWPVTISGSAQNDPSVVFDARYAHQRPGLLLMNGVIYAGFGAHCDIGPYRGWIMGVSTAGAVTARFVDVANTPNVSRGNGIWMSGSGLASDGADRIFFATGNGFPVGGIPYAGATPGNTPPGDLEEAAVRLDVRGDGTLTAGDFFAPYNAKQLNDADQDLGSGGVVLLPAQFGTAQFPHLAVVAGKGGYAYLLNRDSLGGHKQGPAGGDNVLSMAQLGGATWSHAAVWPGDGGYIYITTNGGGGTPGNGFRLQALKYGTDAQGMPTISVIGQAAEEFSIYSGSPTVTSNGTASGSALVWATNLSTAELRVYDAVPVNGVLNLRFRKAYGNQAKFTTVGVGAGKVYVGSGDGYLIGYGVMAAPITGAAVAFGSVGVGQTSTLTATVTATQTVTVTGLGTSNGAFTLGASTPPLPVTLNANQSLTVPVSFRPTASSGYSALLNVTTATPAIGTVSLSGTGQVTGAQLNAQPMTVNFGGVETGATKSVTLVLQNTGSQTLTFQGYVAPVAPFGATGVPGSGATLAPGASVTVNATYTPIQAVTSSQNLTITSDGGTVSIPLTGTSGAPAKLVISPLLNDFGTLALGETKTLSFTLKNAGGVDLTITKSKFPALGTFVPQTTLGEGSVLTPGQVVTETVAFSSQTAGTFSDSWPITGSDTSGLQTVAFTGMVVAPPRALQRAGWLATASATGAGDVAGNALDGNLGTRFTTGAPQSQASNTFTVDMQSAQSFNQISIDSEGGDYARNFSVYATNDPANWGPAIATGTGTAAITTVDFGAQTARYIQIRQAPAAGVGAWWSIQDFNVYGSGAAVAPGAPLTRAGWVLNASATAADDAVGNPIDGLDGTRWSSGQAQSAPATQTFTIDLLTAQPFGSITLASGGDYARNYSVFASNDATNWGTAIATGVGTGANTSIFFATQNARYIQIRQAPSPGAVAWWSIYELNVLSPAGNTGAGLTALARAGWIATGSATAEPPNNALDGNPATRWSTTTAQVSGQYLQVDMLSPRTFQQITLDAGTSTGDYPRGYQVLTSSDGTTWSGIAAGFGAAQLVTIAFAPQTARFIKVVQTGTAVPSWWSVHELNVYN